MKNEINGSKNQKQNNKKINSIIKANDFLNSRNEPKLLIIKIKNNTNNKINK
tara:strand:+ start:218 stop:373 length:156 start_codon:yes stop_codon:yes gene_type:complete